VSKVRSFLGLAGYYRHFIKDFAKLARPLHALARDQATFAWGAAEQLSMDLIKDAICKTQGLSRPDFNLPFLLDTDYSRIGIGATLSQLNAKGLELPIAFPSRALHGAQANYSTADGKILALVWAITVRFCSYLYEGPTFTVQVDHKPLVWLHQQTNLTGRLARWHIRLMEYNFKVVHCAGRAHSNVDPLSRNPVATLPWEAAAGDLEDFPEYATPEFGDGLNPPFHPTIRMVLLNRDVDSSEDIEDNPTSPSRQNLSEGQEPEEEGEGDTPDYLLMAPSKLLEEHTLRLEDTRFLKRIDPRKLFPDQEEESEEEWVEACKNAPWEVSSGNESKEDIPEKADD
jgi:hypothetical protein